jgi:hypothetical protein
MRMIVLSALFAAGVGLAGAGSAVAAPLSNNGINNAAQSASIVDQIQFRGRGCRTVRVCRSGWHGRRTCRVDRVCGRR